MNGVQASGALGSGAAGSDSGKEFPQASNLDGGGGYDHYASKIQMYHPSQVVRRPGVGGLMKMLRLCFQE